MAYPPEKSPAYPPVNGRQDYIGSQLADFVAQAGHAGAEAHLVPDNLTQREADNGRARGYSVIVNDGQYALIPGRFYADPASVQAQVNAAARAGLEADQGRSALRPSLASGRWGGFSISEPVGEAARSVARPIVEGVEDVAERLEPYFKH
jgi:hypothetical protein